MPISNKSGGGPFYKTGPLYIHGESHDGDPTDPTKKKAAEKEAKAKAEKSAAEAKKVYGKSTTTTERFKDDRGAGTRTTVTTPYSQSGGGSAEFNVAYAAAKKAGKQNFNYNNKLIKVEDAASRTGQDVKTSVKYDPIKPIGLKPQGVKLTTAGPSAPVPKISKPKPSMPTYSFSMKKQSGTTLVDKKLPSKSNLARPKKSGGGSCGCKY